MKIQAAVLAILILLANGLVACGGDRPASDDAESARAAATAPDAAETASGEGVTYEPAFPEEVSSEGLSEQDVAQQEAGHGHSEGADHDTDHGDVGHSHREGADHDHDDHDH